MVHGCLVRWELPIPPENGNQVISLLWLRGGNRNYIQNLTDVRCSLNFEDFQCSFSLQTRYMSNVFFFSQLNKLMQIQENSHGEFSVIMDRFNQSSIVITHGNGNIVILYSWKWNKNLQKQRSFTRVLGHLVLLVPGARSWIATPLETLKSLATSASTPPHPSKQSTSYKVQGAIRQQHVITHTCEGLTCSRGSCSDC